MTRTLTNSAKNYLSAYVANEGTDLTTHTFVVYLPVTVAISFPNHFCDLAIGQFLP